MSDSLDQHAVFAQMAPLQLADPLESPAPLKS
jgi:hypothetical protein